MLLSTNAIGTFVEPFSYSYNTRGHGTTGMTASSLVLASLLPVSATFVTPTAVTTDTNAETTPEAHRLLLLSRRAEMRQNEDMRTEAARHG